MIHNNCPCHDENKCVNVWVSLRISCLGKVMARVENITGDVWELEGGVGQEQ